ncbi:MAG: transposase [Myxococcales bacterium]|nr:transposase [Myxococcales bacterium]
MSYSTDLTDAQWQAVEPIFKEELGNHGNRVKWSKRTLMNAVLYLTKQAANGE